MVDPLEARAKSVLHPKTVLVSTIKTLPDYSNPAVLHQKYVLEGLSVKQIAASSSVSKSAILDGLKRFQIPLRAKHLSHGRPSNPRFGYQMRDGHLVENPREQRIIRRMKQMYLKEGASLNAIAKALTLDKILTRNGKTRWHHEMVKSVLKKAGLL